MADVRLTATNPEDSSVVPVACDAAGRLLIEEPQVIEGPPGPPGEQGPPGQDGQDGDPFSGNFAGDVTFGGSAAFRSTIDVYDAGATNRAVRIQPRFGGFLEVINTSESADATVFQVIPDAPANAANIKLKKNGSAEFAGQVLALDIVVRQSNDEYPVYRGLAVDGTNTSRINGDGSAKFAGGKAGFTPEGCLWCTTRRGDTVILDATSNGLASWVEYTPTTRLEEIRDKLDANRGETGEMPADTQ